MFNFYRIIIDGGDYKTSNLLKALDDARSHDVDIINLSLGVSHDDCGGRCRSCVATTDVVDDGVVVVAAAGNEDDGDSEPVACPARAEGAIAVGSSVTYCTASLNQPSVGIQTGDGRPPGSYWVDTPRETREKAGHPEHLSNANFCGFGNCSPYHTCNEYQNEVVCDGNVSERDKIDIFAPGDYPREADGSAVNVIGTSFSTALTTGVIACMLSDLFEIGAEPSPRQVKRALVNGADQIDGGYPQINYRRTVERLKSRFS